MPYANKKEMQRQWVSKKYRESPEFREAEAKRKADWYQRNRDAVILKVTADKLAKRKIAKVGRVLQGAGL